MREIRKYFSICLAIIIVMLFCGCSQVSKASEPTYTATIGGNSDTLVSLGYIVQSGNESDINALRTILNYNQMRELDSEKGKKVDVVIDENTYSVVYRTTNLAGYCMPDTYDVYGCKDENGQSVSVYFPTGNTSKVIGYMFGHYDGYSNSELLANQLSEEELVGLAKKEIAKYTDEKYYNDYSINYRYDPDLMSYGWYEVTFYATVSGIRAADFANVWIYANGRVRYVKTPPTTGIANKVSSRLDAATCDAMAEEQITAMYCKEDAELEYVSRELSKRQLTLDDDGTPVIIYYYKVKLHDPNPLTRADGFTLPDTFTDFATVAVWLK